MYVIEISFTIRTDSIYTLYYNPSLPLPYVVPNVLAEAKVTDTKVFALCYRNGGGIFTIGGVSQQIHAKRSVNYAQMEVRQGWYGVTLTNIRFIDPKSGAVTELPPATKNLFGGTYILSANR